MPHRTRPPHACGETFSPETRFRDDLLACMPEMKWIARRLCGDRDAADDALQTAFLRAWAARQTFRPGTDVKAWFFVIMRNAIASRARHERRMVPWTDQMLERLPAQESDVHAAVELSRAVRGLGTLPAEQRLAVLAVGPAGLSYETVASACGCAPGTIKSRVFRGRANLRRVLETGEKRVPRRAATVRRLAS